jgi:hypothetical protein
MARGPRWRKTASRKGCSRSRASPDPIPFSPVSSTSGRKTPRLQPRHPLPGRPRTRPDRDLVVPLDSRVLRLGLRPDCGSVVQPGSCGVPALHRQREERSAVRPAKNQTVGHVLRRQGIAPVRERSKKTTWKDLIRRHMDILAGTDFFMVGDRMTQIMHPRCGPIPSRGSRAPSGPPSSPLPAIS